MELTGMMELMMELGVELSICMELSARRVLESFPLLS